MQCYQQERQVTRARFISCGPAHLSSPDPEPLVTFTFAPDEEQDHAEEFVTGLQDARDLAVELLASLACHGDDVARAIVETHFLSE